VLYIEKAVADRGRVRPGDTIRLRVRLRAYQGDAFWKEITVPVPPRVQGDRILVLVTSLEDFLAWDQERAPGKYTPKDLEHLLELLTDLPSQGDLLVKVYSPSAGALIRGRELGSLPGSVLRVLGEPATRGTVEPVSGLLLHEERLPMDAVVVGGEGIVLDVERKGIP
jgi:hypothetical protein